ncbi:hypothetical protein [Pseudomonas sp. SMV7]|uniref:hypothetical protein n=1 Tax=Pseudomonas sp. SMV7 TaxID=3390194 RepID=UPI003F86D1FB
MGSSESIGLCLLSLDVTGTGAMGVPSWRDGRNPLKRLAFVLLQGWDCRLALLHIETV